MVKQGQDAPQFQQQQQNNQQQCGDGEWHGRGQGRRQGKRGGQKNSQQQLQQAPAQQAPTQTTSQGPPQPPSPQFQWVAGPSSSASHLGYFASPIEARPPPPPSSIYPTFNRALELSRKIGVRPSTETIKTLEVAEIAKES